MPDLSSSAPAPSPPWRPADLAADLATELGRYTAQAASDPFGNPLLSMALLLTRSLDQGRIGLSDLQGLVGHVAAEAFAGRAERLAAYVGPVDRAANDADLVARLEQRLEGLSLDQARRLLERTAFGIVFTAHPTFSLRRDLADALAEAASGVAVDPQSLAAHPHRPPPSLTLQDEFEWAMAAIGHGRAALDQATRLILAVAQRRWPDQWRTLVPIPVTIASWVGTDTDGRTDIGWWDSLRLRLEVKAAQLDRLILAVQRCMADHTAGGLALSGLLARLQTAAAAVSVQRTSAPPMGATPSPAAAQRFAAAIVDLRSAALSDTGPLLSLIDQALAGAEDDLALSLQVMRAGLVGHGLGLARTHVRLNATQIHNAVRRRLDLPGDPADPSHRRSFLGAMGDLIGACEPVPVSFGDLVVEPASATRLMMTVAQYLKHIDGSVPVRFLIAETETGYTLLAALWLARRFGIDDRVEISPLFETAEGLERGAQILDEALRSQHYRDYVRRHGRIAVQFGYSDSGRYIGQLAATYWIERLQLRLAVVLGRHGLGDIELVLFNTHGESIGRGGHPNSLMDRLAYLCPPATRAAFAGAALQVTEESSFQGGDGYLLFGTADLAYATVARVLDHCLDPVDEGDDPIYREPDYAAEFFTSIRQSMLALVEDPGYAGLLGAFGPSLLDKSGSRPSARESDGLLTRQSITHPSQLRAIPNNGILHQLGYLANTIHGLGRAAERNPDLFRDLRRTSARFGRALAMVQAARMSGDLDILRAYVDSLDPGTWLNRAARTTRPGRRWELRRIADALERADRHPAAIKLFRRLQADDLALAAVLPAPSAPPRLLLLHAVRLALVQRIWLIATHIPDFSPQRGITPEELFQRLLMLDVPACLALMQQFFPVTSDPALGLDFREPGAREARPPTYEREHWDIFEPIAHLFDLVRAISGAITHEVGAFG
ncbi:MAG: phosphoenolpyruvate carboxylase [Alphaproteobacteria bacterium]|nr:MAG: phosphoenolpyruvate carboxylase [Alphaproteobacteria bacterium]